MYKINAINIENFRGISKKLQLDFKTGKTSVVIYGRNGSGKSSIVDAWEWLYSNKIVHLSREGVGEKDFPNRNGDIENCYIEIELIDKNINEIVRCQFNKNKVTDPIRSKTDLVIDNITHPCHLRFKDLQEFVYFTKTEKYKYLAKYLGFETFLTVQEGSYSLLSKIQEKIQREERSLQRLATELEELIDGPISEEAITNAINLRLIKHNLTNAVDLEEAKQRIKDLENKINNNPISQVLSQKKADLSTLVTINSAPQLDLIFSEIESLFGDIKSNEENITRIYLKDLYDVSLKILEKRTDSKCPLCDVDFDGNLREYIFKKHSLLESLAKSKKDYDNKKSILANLLKPYQAKILSFKNGNIGVDIVEYGGIIDKITSVEIELNRILQLIDTDIVKLDIINLNENKIVEKINEICLNVKEKEEFERVEISKLEKEIESTDLAKDFKAVNDIIRIYNSYNISTRKVGFLTNISSKYEKIYIKFNLWVKEQIQNAFDKISNDVVDFFKILESDSPHIRNPKIVLNTDKNKAIELEIEYDNDKISPAYKVLSESQVNSFGLSIFLASIKNFNQSIKFAILDDVINSFDVYKRPKVIELLNQHFKDFQFLVLTHDQIWFEQVKRAFKPWTKLHFAGWDSTNGPKVQLSYAKLEEIKNYLNDDKPIPAGTELGRYLEWVLQEFNQNLQTQIKYKIDNQYTLSELFEPFKSRIKEKLKSQHDLFLKLESFEQNTIFRNFCAHYKNTETEFSTSELSGIVDKWEEIELIMICSACNELAKYDSSDKTISCRCKKLNLAPPKT